VLLPIYVVIMTATCQR